MNLSPRGKFGILLGGIFLVVWAWISLIFSLGNGGSNNQNDDFSTNIQQAIPEEIDEQNGQTDSNSNNTADGGGDRTTRPTTTQPTVKQNPGSSITIIVPPIIERASREYIHNAINNKSQQQTRLLYYPSWELYTRAVRDTLSEQNRHDIVLIPSLWYESFLGRTMQFQLQETMKSLFHPMTMDWFFNEQITVIPFALDPFVIGTYEELQQPVTVADLIEKRNLLATFFGFAVDQRQGSITWGTTASQELLHRALVDAATTGAKRRVSFLLLGSDIIPESMDCNGLFSWCAFHEQGLTTTIAPLSEFTTIDTKPFLYNLPVSDNTYPIVGRGFVIPTTSDNQSAAAQRLSHYLELSANGELIYPPYLLSASIRTLQWQRIENRYATMQAFFNTPSLLVGGLDQPSFATLPIISSYQDGLISLDLLLQQIGDRL